MDVTSIFEWLRDCLVAAVNVFEAFVTGDLWILFVTMFMMFLAVRFFLAPVLGSTPGLFDDFVSSASDSYNASKQRKRDDRIHREWKWHQHSKGDD